MSVTCAATSAGVRRCRVSRWLRGRRTSSVTSSSSCGLGGSSCVRRVQTSSSRQGPTVEIRWVIISWLERSIQWRSSSTSQTIRSWASCSTTAVKASSTSPRECSPTTPSVSGGESTPSARPPASSTPRGPTHRANARSAPEIAANGISSPPSANPPPTAARSVGSPNAAIASVTSRVLPMPASPSIRSRAGSPPRTSSTVRRSCSISASRPTSRTLRSLLTTSACSRLDLLATAGLRRSPDVPGRS